MHLCTPVLALNQTHSTVNGGISLQLRRLFVFAFQTYGRTTAPTASKANARMEATWLLLSGLPFTDSASSLSGLRICTGCGMVAFCSSCWPNERWHKEATGIGKRKVNGSKQPWHVFAHRL